MARSASIRASDADRDAIADRLHRAAVEGRIEPDELEERLHQALRARTYGDLRRLVADLPRTPARRSKGASLTAVTVAIRVVVVLVAIVAVVTVAVLMATWWIVWAVLWMTLRTRRHGWMRPRSISPRTMPSFRSHRAL
jgi:Flp pilus assembly protein TadB